MAEKKTNEIIVAVSGGFDPIHVGHIRMFKEAKALGDELVVILNNDNWLMVKKGFVFMSEIERKEILEALRYVDRVVLTKHSKDSKDISVSDALREIKPAIFANGGDRTKENIPEVAVCKKINCQLLFNIGKGGKVQSSSWLVEQAAQKKVTKEKPR